MNFILYVHSQKAIKAKVPGEQVSHERRLLVVTGTEGVNYIAWKCTITKQGIGHPSSNYVPQPVSVATLREFRSPKQRNGSIPTAMFKPDSFYKRIGIADLRKIVAAMPESPAKICPHCGATVSGKATWDEPPKRQTRAKADMRTIFANGDNTHRWPK